MPPLPGTKTDAVIVTQMMQKLGFNQPNYDADEVLKELLKDPKYKKEWNKNQKLEHDPRITKIGKILEAKAISKTRNSISSLMDIKPEYANIKDKEEIREEIKRKDEKELEKK